MSTNAEEMGNIMVIRDTRPWLMVMLMVLSGNLNGNKNAAALIQRKP